MKAISSTAAFAMRILVFSLMGASLARAQSGDPSTDPSKSDVDPQASWSTPGDGRLVMLLRNSTDHYVIEDPTFRTAVPFRVRVCVTNFAGVNNSVNLFVWTTDGPGPNGKAASVQPQVLHPGLGDCVEINRPAAIIVQDATTSGSASGYYELLQAVALPEKSRVTRNTRPKIGIGHPETKPVSCDLLPIGKSPNFAKSCKFNLLAARNEVGVRICTDDKFVNIDGSPDNYPAGYLELTTIDLTETTKPSDYNYNWNPVTPVSCRDIIWQAPVDRPIPHSVFFMVGPAKPVPVWDPRKVNSLTIVTQKITLGGSSN